MVAFKYTAMLNGDKHISSLEIEKKRDAIDQIFKVYVFAVSKLIWKFNVKMYCSIKIVQMLCCVRL